MTVSVLASSVSRAGGGLFPSLVGFASGLFDLGVDVRIFGLRDGQLKMDRTAWPAPIRPTAFPVRGPASFGFAPELLNGLAQVDADLLHLHGLWMYPSVAASRWRARNGRPVVISPHGMLDPWAVRRSGWKKRLAHSFYEGENLRKAACLHALTESEAQALRDYGLANPIAVIPNGTVPPSDAELEAVPPPAWMAGDDRSVLLFLGRIHPKKGLSETLPAWARLKMEDPKLAAGWRLVVAGWGEAGYLERLRTQTARLRLERDVTFVGSLYGKDKFAAFAHASVFILASHSEGLPVAVLEAWAHRLPALISPACNLSEAVQAGAAIQAAGNTDEIALGLAKVMRMERQDLKAMGINGRRLVECQYAWPRIAAEMAGVYAWILGRGARPSCVQLD